MRYVSISEPGTCTIEEMAMPVPGPGEALLRIRYGGICGSDVGTYRGSFLYASYPRIPGHEFSAEVVEVGAGAAGLEPGMLVTGNPYYNCGSCYSCQRGLVNCCMSNQTLGAQRDGIFREFFPMPVERIYPGRGLDAQSLAVVEPFCISHHGVQRAGVREGETVLVIGAGPIGLLALLAARLQGATVTVADVNQARLQRALELGAGQVVDTGRTDLAEAARDLTGGRGFDVVMECVGVPETFLGAIEAAAFRGRIVLVGIGKKSVDFAFARIQTKELDIFGSRNALRADFEDAIAQASSGELDLRQLVTRVAPLDEAPEAFREAAEEPEKVIKTLVEFAR